MAEPLAYFETEISDLAVDEANLVYNNTKSPLQVTVYRENGDVDKYWNCAIIKDLTGYARIAAPREKMVMWFNWLKWTGYYFVQTGHTELVLMPDASKRHINSIPKR